MRINKKYDMFYDPTSTFFAKTRKRAGNALIYAILIALSIIWVVPFIYLFLQSFTNKYDPGFIIPQEGTWTFENYTNLFTSTVYPFWRWYLNTLMIAICVSILNTVLTLMTAYAFSRLQFKTRKAYMKLILVIGMFPGFLGMFISYAMLKKLGLYQGYLGLAGLVLISIAGSAGGYYISKGFFDTISKNIDEAAMVDGATKSQIFWQIILPLAKPIIVYTILTSFMGPWGDYITSSYIIGLQNIEDWTVAIGLFQFVSGSQDTVTSYYIQFAPGAVCVALPIVVLFFMLQKYYVSGVTGGAVKG
jgi:arabinogalactan oligomer/maltooligosaccharide transport system permease protein